MKLRGQDPTTIYAFALGRTNGARICGQQALSVTNTSTRFHTEGVDWEPNTIAFSWTVRSSPKRQRPPAWTHPCGDATIPALAGNDTILGGIGKLTFIEGGRANDTLGSGPVEFDISDGFSGGNLSIHNFVPGLDTTELFNYAPYGSTDAVEHETFSGGAADIVLWKHPYRVPRRHE